MDLNFKKVMNTDFYSSESKEDISSSSEESSNESTQ